MTTTKINSKKKGSRFERKICKVMFRWTGYEFARTPQSGGLRWKKNDNIVSDVVCVDEKHASKFQFAVECKSYQEIKFEHILLDTKSCKINEFWTQVVRDSKRAKKLPMLIMRYNAMPRDEAFVALDKTVSNTILNNFYKKEDYFQKPMMAVRLKKDFCLYIFLLTDLVKLPYREVYKLLKPVLASRYAEEKK